MILSFQLPILRLGSQISEVFKIVMKILAFTPAFPPLYSLYSIELSLLWLGVQGRESVTNLYGYIILKKLGTVLPNLDYSFHRNQDKHIIEIE